MKLEIDGLRLDGYPDLSPYDIDVEGFESGPPPKQYTWAESTYGASAFVYENRSLLERSFPLIIRSRFASAITNLITDPIPQGGGSIWTAKGTITSIATDTDTLPPSGTTSVKVITNGNATTGGRVSFTATAAAHSASIWVNAPSGAPMSAQFNGETTTTFTGTGDWQEVKTENKTLTAATRYVEVTQTDTGSRTFYIANCVAVLAATAPYYFDGSVGDATWTGTAHASTSTTKVGADATSLAVGVLEDIGKKAEYRARYGGLAAHYTKTGSTYPLTIDVYSAETSGENDWYAENKNVLKCDFKIYAAPNAHGPEYTLTTASKAGGPPALEITATGAKGDLPGPARILIENTSGTDQKFVAVGMQHREYESGTSLIVRGEDLAVTDFSGASTAGIDEVQTVTITGSPTGGTFQLTLDGHTAAGIAYNATAADVQTALRALANIGSTGVTCAGGPLPGTPVTCTFAGPLSSSNINMMSGAIAFTGGSSPNVSVAQTTAGVAGYASATLTTGADYTTICSTGNLAHVGSYRVWARVYDAFAADYIGQQRVRLSWAQGDQPQWTTNDPDTPAAVGDHCWVDLGPIHIAEATAGAQRWVGRIEGKTLSGVSAALRCVEIALQPLETGAAAIHALAGGGASTVVKNSDTFLQTAGSLATKVSDSGHTWSGAGDATDFAVNATSDTAYRSASADADEYTGRYAILGSTNHAEVIARTVCSTAMPLASVGMGVFIRYVDVNNWIHAVAHVSYYDSGDQSYTILLWVRKRVGGVVTTVGFSEELRRQTPNTEFAVSLYGGVDGSWSATLNDGILSLTGNDSDLATGGSLASGKTGLYDYSIFGASATRTYARFETIEPVAPQTAIYKSNREIDIRGTDGRIIRESSDGNTWGEPSSATWGRLPHIGPAGRDGLSNRILIMASRYNPDLASDPFSDSYDVTIKHTPTYALSRYES